MDIRLLRVGSRIRVPESRGYYIVTIKSMQGERNTSDWLFCRENGEDEVFADCDYRNTTFSPGTCILLNSPPKKKLEDFL